MIGSHDLPIGALGCLEDDWKASHSDYCRRKRMFLNKFFAARSIRCHCATARWESQWSEICINGIEICASGVVSVSAERDLHQLNVICTSGVRSVCFAITSE